MITEREITERIGKTFALKRTRVDRYPRLSYLAAAIIAAAIIRRAIKEMKWIFLNATSETRFHSDEAGVVVESEESAEGDSHPT